MNGTPPRVLVLVRPTRVQEGLRMASALPLADSEVDVFLLGDRLSHTEAVDTHLETLREFECGVMASFADPRVETVTTTEMAARLTDYDHVITF